MEEKDAGVFCFRIAEYQSFYQEDNKNINELY